MPACAIAGCADAGPFAQDPAPLPPAIVDRAHHESRFTKAGFFPLLRTNYRSNFTGRAYHSPHRVIDVASARLTACVTGDSIAEEVVKSLQGLLGEANVVFMTRSLGMIRAENITGCEEFSTSDRSSDHLRRNFIGRGCRECDVVFVTGTWLHWLYREPPLTNPFRDVKQPPLELDDSTEDADQPVVRRVRYFEELVARLEAWADCARKHVVVVGSGVIDEPTTLSAPASKNWFRFYPLEISKYWRQRELEVMGSRQQKKWVHYLDHGALGARYAGVRCDGTHFFSWHQSKPGEEYDCQPSTGLWDGLVLDALASTGHVRRCSCTMWQAVSAPPPRAGHAAAAAETCTRSAGRPLAAGAPPKARASDHTHHSHAIVASSSAAGSGSRGTSSTSSSPASSSGMSWVERLFGRRARARMH